MKRILDSVHGHISIDDHYFEGIIDTPYFQRLRQIEQTSTRSIFPSARHDRFIHSLGVFHIGSMICQHIVDEYANKKNTYKGITPARITKIAESYRLACLLHDVAHAPFSHTFEEYYGKKEDLGKSLIDNLQSPEFTKDLNDSEIENPAPHEYASALLCVKKFNRRIEELGGDVEMVARMIIGCHYSDNDKSIENCFIELIHGDFIDADRLDYACRDVWASGYCTSTIDLTRLISSIHIKYHTEENRYVVCFDINGLNEMESVMQVKDFQMQYTINHHKVKLEQWLLVNAAQCLALKYFKHDEIENENDRGTKALYDLFDLSTFDAPKSLNLKQNEVKDDDKNVVENEDNHGLEEDSDLLYCVTDGDLLYLMKKQSADNPYYLQWSSRQYNWIPVWKTHTEFAHVFSLEAHHTISSEKFYDMVSQIMDNLGITNDKYLIIPTKYKPKVKLDKAIFCVGKDLVLGKEILPRQEDKKVFLFHYLYVDKSLTDEEKTIIKKINDALKPLIKKLADEGDK